ncbi:hypothetical protein OB236_16620 [Paenibacillus sp. WQ 127069]|uniref:DUF4364 family protein n=1 Tax=Paenibacillus baimaensis TaxID=2982185 RepID=A0ABT2UGG6_9BACL|nr:hypothetical protein [Paenibacillus sp. WQ 127069]MCU6793730.1 hypothetical protein [Paenibacillus sp. WQ 127069]
MDFRHELILIYFASVEDDFLLSDLVELLGIDYGILDEMLQTLINESYLVYDEYNLFVLSEHAQLLLRSKNLHNINLFELQQKSPIKYVDNPLPINGLYVPKHFDKKFKSY